MVDNNQKIINVNFDELHDSSFSYEILDNEERVYLFTHLQNSIHLNFNLKNYAKVKLLFLSNEDNCDLDLTAHVKDHGELTVYFAEFSKKTFSLSTNINLDGEFAKCNWNLASLSKGEERKCFDVSVIHNFRNTECLINNFGVCRDNSKLEFSGICHILNGSHNSKAHQNAKIMVFDKESTGLAKPILKIDDNEIEASHAAVVGKISDDHLFYICSRGLSVDDAKKLITYGYLKPILLGFDDSIKNDINNLIEGNI